MSEYVAHEGAPTPGGGGRVLGHVVIYQLFFYWKLLGSYFGAFGHQ